MKKNPGTLASLGLLWSSVILAGFLNSVLTGTALPTFLTAVILRPLFLLVFALCIVLIVGLVLRVRVDELWTKVMNALPAALLFGLGLSLIGIWNDGSGIVALPLKNAGVFILTLGIFPLKAGPEILVRGAAIGLIVLVALNLYCRRFQLMRLVVAAVLAWVAGALSLLVQTWLAYFSAVANNLTLVHSQDAVQALGWLHTNTQWTTYQADRFFTGVGKQLETGIVLSSSSILFLLACALGLLLLSKVQPYARSGVARALIRRLLPASYVQALPAVALVGGLAAGWNSVRWSWGALDFVALALLLVAFIAWSAIRTYGNDLKNIRRDEEKFPNRPLPAGLIRPDELTDLCRILLPVMLAASFLLGWPVFLAALALLAVDYTFSAILFPPAEKVLSFAKNMLFIALLVMLGGVFVTRTAFLPKGDIGLALGLALLYLPLKKLDLRRRP